MRQTSLSHPLQIAAISAGAGFGRVGITFCPGKYDRNAVTGYWDRDLDLDLDLDAIRNWGAAAVVTLLETSELSLLRVGAPWRRSNAPEYAMVPSSHRRCVNSG
jgi:ADP-ribosyl-[dinitrogen reductase] hydrolase